MQASIPCPTCQGKMEVRCEGKTTSRKHNKTYERTVYTCDQDDTWVSIEVPLAQSGAEIASTVLA